MKKLTPNQQKKLEEEEQSIERAKKIRLINKELIPYCNKNNLDYDAAYKLVLFSKIVEKEEYKSEHILPYDVYIAFKKYLGKLA